MHNRVHAKVRGQLQLIRHRRDHARDGEWAHALGAQLVATPICPPKSGSAEHDLIPRLELHVAPNLVGVLALPLLGDPDMGHGLGQ